MNDEKKNIIWITGGGSGIGRAITERFVSEGISVAVSSRSEELLLRLQIELKDEKGSVDVVPMDITDAEQVIKAYEKIIKSFNIKCLINNAGITSFSKAVDTELPKVERIISTNLIGAIYVTQTVLPSMIEQGSGTIININSVAAKKIFPNSSVYSASKSGLLSYSNVLREEVRDKNIRVINLLPGATKTPIWPNEILEKQSEKMMSPNDIASLIYSLYADESNMVVEEIILRPVTGDL